jgi:hypothetical protein
MDDVAGHGFFSGPKVQNWSCRTNSSRVFGNLFSIRGCASEQRQTNAPRVGEQ